MEKWPNFQELENGELEIRAIVNRTNGNSGKWGFRNVKKRKMGFGKMIFAKLGVNILFLY